MDAKVVPLTGIYLLMIVMLIASCAEDTKLERLNFSSKEGDSRSSTKNTDAGDDQDDKKKSKKGVKKNSSDQPAAASGSADSDEEKVIEYPQLSFAGNGYTTYKLDDKFAMTMDLETKLDEDELAIKTTTAKVECGDKGGCDQKDVDKDVAETSLGANVYRRTTKSEARVLKKNNYNLPPYAIFAGKVLGKNGINFTFDQPLPVYPWPGSVSRYEGLDGEPATWTVNVTADQHVPNDPDVSINDAKNSGPSLEKSGKALQQFQVGVTVTKIASTSNEITLKFETTIPADKKRVLYEHVPLPRSSEYKINTDTKTIVEVFTTNWSNGDKSEEPEESVLTYKICASKTKEETKQFNCR